MQIYNDIKSIVKSKLFENFSYLSISHIVNFIFPIFTFPYITRIFGPEGYGLISFLQSFVTYFVIIADYGLGMISPSILAKERNDLKKLSEVFSSIFVLKLLLIFVTIILITIFVVLNDGLIIYAYYIFIIFLGIGIFSNLNPFYFFQAMEEMKYITYINIFVKFLSIVMLFSFINSYKDISLYLWINTIAIFINMLFSLFLIYKKFNLIFLFPSYKNIIDLFRKATFSFFSVVFMNFYVISNEFFLGIWFNKKEVGLYSAPYRIIYYFMGFIFIISQVLYPRMSVISKESIQKSYMYSKKIIFYILPVILFFSSIIFFFSENIIFLFLGYEYYQSVTIIKIMAFVPIFLFLSNLFATQIILASGNYKNFFYISFFGFIINILSNFFITSKYGAIGATISLFATEILVFFISYYIVIRVLYNEKRAMYSNSNL